MENKEQKKGFSLGWKDWLRIALFLLLDKYIPTLAVVILLFVGEVFLGLTIGLIKTAFVAASPVPAFPSKTTSQI